MGGSLCLGNALVFNKALAFFYLHSLKEIKLDLSFDLFSNETTAITGMALDYFVTRQILLVLTVQITQINFL